MLAAAVVGMRVALHMACPGIPMLVKPQIRRSNPKDYAGDDYCLRCREYRFFQLCPHRAAQHSWALPSIAGLNARIVWITGKYPNIWP
jgi:hypothetical protein